MKDVLAVVLAGGKGSRLEPLTRDRAKPAVPFGGTYRIIDFTLSNCLNSGMRRVLVLTQYKAMSLDRHVTLGWRDYFCRELGEFVDVVPPQQRIDEQWYQGTADAVYQNIYTLEKERPKHVVILAGDHIYKMDYAKLVAQHIERNADLTIAALTVTKKEATEFGVMQVDSEERVVGFEEKSPTPKTIPGDPDHCLASMGIYVFNSAFLFDELCRDATLPESAHDFGKNIIPSIIDSRRVYAFPFRDENSPDGSPGAQAYWRDVGTIDAYFEANLELTNVAPQLNLYDGQWPIRTHQPNLPPAKTVFAEDEANHDGGAGGPRRGEALDSIVSPGAILSGGVARQCVIGPGARINSYAQVEESILFADVNIGRRCRIRRAIIDKGVHVPEGTEIGYDHDADRARGFTVSEGGVVVIAKNEGTLPVG